VNYQPTITGHTHGPPPGPSAEALQALRDTHTAMAELLQEAAQQVQALHGHLSALEQQAQRNA